MMRYLTVYAMSYRADHSSVLSMVYCKLDPRFNLLELSYSKRVQTISGPDKRPAAESPALRARTSSNEVWPLLGEIPMSV